MSCLNSISQPTRTLIQNICIIQILLSSLLINTTRSHSIVKSVRLSPSLISSNGARILTNANEVTSINNEWHTTVNSQHGWQFILFIDKSFGFNPNLESSIHIDFIINKDSWNPGNELLFGFTSTNKEYISTFIPLSELISQFIPNQIYPSCNQSPNTNQPLGLGDIAGIPQFDRSCDIADHSCNNWSNMLPSNQGLPVHSPFTFTLNNNPLTNTLTFSLQSTTFPIQHCIYQTFPTNNGLKIYISGNDPGQRYILSSINIESTIKYTTIPPTQDPTSFPTMDPTNFPTPSPTKYPTPAPTNNPTISPTPSPTEYPTISTNNPSVTPSKYPTYNPTITPTYNPSITPTNNPSITPSKYPTNIPTYNPTITPTYNPSITPTNNPSITPSKYPTNIPTNNPSITPTYNPTTALPTSNPVPAGYQWGPYGQLCTLGSVDKQCRFINDKIISNTHIMCLQAYDCCMCNSIQCGDINANIPCNLVEVGQYGIYGVQNIQIMGNEMGVNGVDIDCRGEESCARTIMEIYNPNHIYCTGIRSCAFATIIINEPKQQFVLDCSGYESCIGLNIEINTRPFTLDMTCDVYRNMYGTNIFEISKIICGNDYACKQLNILINNKGCDEIIINSLECMQLGACSDAIFNLIGDIKIDNCHCGPSCNTAIGLEQCFKNLQSIKCSHPYSCQNQVSTIINPVDGFEFYCSNQQSCENGQFVIQLNSGDVKSLGSFLMGGWFGARRATFIIENTQGFDVHIDKVECGGLGACSQATFIIGTNVFIDVFSCGTDACYGCRIKQTINSHALPCDPTQI